MRTIRLTAGHGLGHATRVVEVARWIAYLGHRVTICSGADVKSFLDPEQHGIDLRRIVLDCGSVQVRPCCRTTVARIDAMQSFYLSTMT